MDGNCHMLNAIRSEWIKATTLPSIKILIVLLFLAFFFFQYQVYGFNEAISKSFRAGVVGEGAAGTALIENLESSIFNPGILLVILGAIIAGAEFRSGQLGMSVVAVPARPQLVAAKVLATLFLVIIIGLIWSLLGIALTLAAAPEVGLGALWQAGLAEGLARILLFMASFAVFPLSLSLIARRALTGIIAAMILIMLTMSQIVALASATLDSLLPLSAARNLLLQGTDNPVPLTGSAVNGATILALWALATTAIAMAHLSRRDVS